MKHVFINVGAMAAFSLVEATLLIVALTMNFSRPYPGWHLLLIWWGQWILIPGSAALMSRFVLGSYGWTGRALRLFATGCVGLPMSMVLLGLILSAFEWIFTTNWTSNTPIVILSSLVVLAVAGIAVVFFLLIKRAARRSLEREAERWLAERRQCPEAMRRLQQCLGRRLTAWVPTLTVLLVFLFFPEVWGVVSHVRHPGYGSIHGFRFSTPLAWIVLDGEQFDDGRSRVMSLVGRGIVFAPGRYLNADMPLSIWDLTSTSFERSPNDLQLRADENAHAARTRAFDIGTEQLRCWEFDRSSLRRLRYGPPVEVDCVGSSHLSAHFAGERDQLRDFYEMLKSVRQDRSP